MASELANYLASDNKPLYGYIANEPSVEDETWKYVIGLNGLRGLEYLPFINDMWQGRGLLFHKPFSQMTSQEYTNFGKLGKQFFKNVLHPQLAKNKKFDIDINFPNARAGESDNRYMEQFPLVRKLIEEAKEKIYTYPKNYGGHRKRTDAEGFNNLKIRWGNEDYAYQVRDNAGHKGNDFYNIKPYSEAIKDKQEQDMYSKLFENLLDDF